MAVAAADAPTRVPHILLVPIALGLALLLYAWWRLGLFTVG